VLSTNSCENLLRDGSNKSFDFGIDPDHDQDSGIFDGILRDRSN